MSALGFTPGRYELFADDDDVIGTTVVKTYPKGWPIVLVDPVTESYFDEFQVGQFLAWCLSNPEVVAQWRAPQSVEALFAATAPKNVTVCGSCGGTGLSDPA